MPFCRFYFGVSLLKLNNRKKGTLIINELLENLDIESRLKGVWSRGQAYELDHNAEVL